MIVDEPLEALDEPDALPQEIVHWQPTRHALQGVGVPSMAGGAVGAVALGALAIGALAIGALAIGYLSVGRAHVRRLEIDKLVIGELDILDRD